ncbi:DNA mismatch repair protein [Aeromonas hydrophila]|uniref:ATP-binding protein n=2 Tax=Aeromonas hydrophila TaxID=644 RepID=UPI000A10FE89|nr:ATP-binding protein [Aeromonas hydrophila]MBC6396308.1 DNA mismatch repair protein [Aeromonas hydrophila]ORJ64663.1 DNA mismatch repair protein [Aeromonas hydrophila]
MKMSQERTTGITDASIKKRFGAIPAWKMLSEYIWNGLDAGASNVDVIINTTGELGGVESIEIHDNGEGIDFHNLDRNFDNWDDSSKKHVTLKGSQGRGRYSFHKYAAKATWYTRNNGENARIEINSSSIKTYKFQLLDGTDKVKNSVKDGSGTSVFLSGITSDKSQKIPSIDNIIHSLSNEFGWKLIVCSEIGISVNGHPLTPPQHKLFQDAIEIDGNKFSSSIIQWLNKPSGEKSYNYFRDLKDRQKHRSLTGFNYKNEFFISGYIQSEWFNDFQANSSPNNDLFMDNEKNDGAKVLDKLLKELHKKTDEIYQTFLRERAAQLVDEFESKGYFPVYQWEQDADRLVRIEHTKKLVTSICMADPSTFNGLKAKQTKIIIALLDRLSTSSENDSLFDVLESILDLDKKRLGEFASQISKSKLDSIISTIGHLQKRDLVIQKMKYLFKEHAKEVLETPDLQGIIEANTWLFGSQYTTIGAEEDDFSKTAKNLRESDIEVLDGDKINSSDLIEGATIEGANGQVDLFLARKMITVDHSTQEEFIKCTIIEIKRPSIALNKKHLSQAERYAEVLIKHPEFNDERMRFDVVLVGTKISHNDTQILRRLKDLAGKGGAGLVSGADERVRVYVKSWSTIFNDFDVTHSALLSKLKIQRSRLEYQSKNTLVNELQVPIPEES